MDAKRWDFAGVGQVDVEGWDRWMWRDGTGGCGGCGGMEKVDVEGWDRRMCTWSEWWGKWMWRNGTARYVHGQADVGVTWRNGTEDAESGCGGMGQDDVYLE